MTHISEILKQGLTTRRDSLPSLQQRRTNKIIETYGNRERFLETFNPDIQTTVCRDPDRCYFGGAPTLWQINAAYGENTAAMWLIPQLTNLSEFSGCKEKLQGKPMKNCAAVIAMEFGYLSVTELLLFFHRFKSGQYGRFYGSVDPLVITTSLRDFLQERSVAYDRYFQEERQRKDEESRKKAITWEEYCLKKSKNKKK